MTANPTANPSREAIMIFRMVGLAALLLAATAAALAQGTPPHGSPRKASEKRFSFGFLAGASLVPPQGRWALDSTRFPFAMYPGSGASPVVVQVGAHDLYRSRYQAAAPTAGMFSTARLTDRVSLQAGLSWRRSYGTTTVNSMFDQPIIYPGSDEPVYSTSGRNDWSDSVWEIPLTVNYRLGRSARRPFVGVGPTFRLQGATGEEAKLGVNAIFGFDLYSSGRWTVTPQVRFTRWFTDSNPWQRRAGNQLQAVVAITF